MTEDTQMGQWDFENAELREPVDKVKRVIVSVSLSRKDYDRISILASDAGRKLSTYMRECALTEHTDLIPPIVHTAGGPGAIVSVVFTTAGSSGGTLAAGQVDAPDQITVQ
ncbi:MAG: hypothetical protein IH867_04845 [Chloroflexi bacterium]|nr:hypothetical protein [Chloroflexota bacterium]